MNLIFSTLMLATPATMWAIGASAERRDFGWLTVFIVGFVGLCACAGELARLENLRRD